MKTHLNLLPLFMQKQGLLRTMLRTWLRVSLLLCVVGAVLYVRLNEQRAAAWIELQKMEETIHPLCVLDDENQKLTLKSSKLEQELAVLSQLEQATTPLSVLGLIGKCVGAVNRPIHLDSLRMEVVATAASDPKKNANPTGRIRLLLTGTAGDDASISAVMMHLRATGVFDSVKLEASQVNSHLAEERRNFQIRCQI